MNVASSPEQFIQGRSFRIIFIVREMQFARTNGTNCRLNLWGIHVANNAIPWIQQMEEIILPNVKFLSDFFRHLCVLCVFWINQQLSVH